MNNDNNRKRISRLTSIITQLQTKRLWTATQLSDKFSVSVRTIYRDIRALEEAGVPIITEEGKGYSIMEHYRLPPVMFTENEANALITAEQLVLKNKDASFIKDYTEAVAKIKAVLKHTLKDKANLLSERVHFSQNKNQETTSKHLSVLQFALTNFCLTEINYTDENGGSSIRSVEPFALYSTQENWLLIAFCRLRNDYRSFRLDRINKLHLLNNTFEAHKLTLEEYFELCRKKYISYP